jgi:hypothetical protein
MPDHRMSCEKPNIILWTQPKTPSLLHMPSSAGHCAPGLSGSVWLLGQFPVKYSFNDFLLKIIGFGLLLILVMLPGSVYTAYARDIVVPLKENKNDTSGERSTFRMG